MAMSEERAEQRLVAALRATADAVAALGAPDHSPGAEDADVVFTVVVEPGRPHPSRTRRRWVPVTVAAAASAAVAAVALVLAGTGPSHEQPGGPGSHHSPRPAIPFATSSAPSSAAPCTSGAAVSCATPVLTSPNSPKATRD